MKYHFTYHIVTHIYFTDQEFDLLTKCIKQHKQTAHTAEQGRFWYSNITRREECNSDLRPKCAATATLKQLEKVLLTSLEPYFLHGYKNQEDKDFVTDLYHKLLKIAEDGKLETNLLNDSGIIYNTGKAKS